MLNTTRQAEKASSAMMLANPLRTSTVTILPTDLRSRVDMTRVRQDHRATFVHCAPTPYRKLETSASARIRPGHHIVRQRLLFDVEQTFADRRLGRLSWADFCPPAGRTGDAVFKIKL